MNKSTVIVILTALFVLCMVCGVNCWTSSHKIVGVGLIVGSFIPFGIAAVVDLIWIENINESDY